MKFEDLKWAAGELVHAFRAPANCDCPAHARLIYALKDDGADETGQGISNISCEEANKPKSP